MQRTSILVQLLQSGTLILDHCIKLLQSVDVRPFKTLPAQLVVSCFPPHFLKVFIYESNYIFLHFSRFPLFQYIPIVSLTALYLSHSSLCFSRTNFFSLRRKFLIAYVWPSRSSG
jgi:hypothetical protein